MQVIPSNILSPAKLQQIFGINKDFSNKMLIYLDFVL